MATLGIVLFPALRIAITRLVCWARRCELRHLAAVTSTGNVPLGAPASCLAPLPHAASATAAVTAATSVSVRPAPLLMTLRRAELSRSDPLTAGATYHLRSRRTPVG